MIIGIAGGTGSGKTTLTQRLKARFGSYVSVVCHDNYYRSNDHLSFEERSQLNYDHPDAFETTMMIAHLHALRRGEAIACPIYSFSEHLRTPESIDIRPSKVIIVEGLLVFQDSALREMMDVKIFVDADADVRFSRRLLRDVHERGRSLDSVISQYLGTVKPMHDQFVEPSKRYSDIVVLGGGHNLVALDMIVQRIEHHIKREQH